MPKAPDANDILREEETQGCEGISTNPLPSTVMPHLGKR